MFAVLLIILAAILIGGIFLYNNLVRGKVRVQEAWSGIDVQLKRRHDLIPNIIEAVKGYMQHERTVLEDIVRLRGQAIQSQDVKDKAAAENGLSASIKTLFAVAENYPNLKADQHFLELQKALTSVEDELQLARRYYNGTVRDYNITVETFPGNLLAGAFNFRAFEFFEVDSALDRQVPAVNITK